VDAAGVKIDSRGRIVADEYFRTSADNVFAAGDVLGPTLASIAMERGRAAARHAVGIPFEGTAKATKASDRIRGRGICESNAFLQSVQESVLVEQVANAL
jgi:pyruvate/2-oxoglutarate dehydrogenase complex dihydrolipoamide dehydrogenase (E3) component